MLLEHPQVEQVAEVVVVVIQLVVLLEDQAVVVMEAVQQV
jgi:hypothetical protein